MTKYFTIACKNLKGCAGKSKTSIRGSLKLANMNGKDLPPAVALNLRQQHLI